MSKRSYMEIVSSACAEVCKNVSEDLRDLRNNFLAGVNDLDTQARSVVVQQCRDFAVTVRVFGIGVSHATTSRTLLQFPPHASDTVILRIAKEMYDAHPDWQSNQQLSLEEFQGKMVMVCKTPDDFRVNVTEPVDEQNNHFVQIVKLHYESLRNHDKAKICEFAVVFRLEERASSPESDRRSKRRKVVTWLANDIINRHRTEEHQVSTTDTQDVDCQVHNCLDDIITTLESDAEVRSCLNDIITNVIHDDEVEELEQFGDSLLLAR
jgi:hypothetical protein